MIRPEPAVCSRFIRSPIPPSPSLPGNEGYGRQRGQHANRASSAEMLFEKDAREDHGDRRIERTQNDGSVETSDLRGANEDDAACYFENSSRDGNRQNGPGQRAKLASGENNSERHDERSEARTARDPECGPLSGAMDAKKETRETPSRQEGKAPASRTAALPFTSFDNTIFGA